MRRRSDRNRRDLATYDIDAIRMSSGRALPSLMIAGEPTARAPEGTSVPLRTTEFAPTTAPARTTTRCITIEPLPISEPSSMVQPSRWTMCPTTQSLPTTVGNIGVVWSTEPSWIDVLSPIRISPSSPRNTAPGQIELSDPMNTDPMTMASGCMKASGAMSGSWLPKA